MPRLMSALLAVLAVVGGSPAAEAQAWPDKPIRFIVPSPPGGGTDSLVRLLANRLGETLHWHMVVDNRPGDRSGRAAEACPMSAATPALPVRTQRLWAALLAATLMNLPLGSVYAFSVLLRPIEQELAIPRSALSLVFGLATVGFTLGSVGAAFLYRIGPAPILVLASALAAGGGLVMAATASGLAQLLVGYGLVFGTGGGVAYILLQQGVNMLVRRRQGLVNGYIVSLYPMGAMLATPAFHACNEAFGWRTTLSGLAGSRGDLRDSGGAAGTAWRGTAGTAPQHRRTTTRKAWPDLLQTGGDVLLRGLGRLDGAEPGARDRGRLWRCGDAGGGGHDRPHRRDRAGPHQRRLAGRPLRGPLRDVRGACAGAGRRPADDARRRRPSPRSSDWR